MSVSANNIIEKQPGEILNLSFEFSNLLNTGDSIDSIVYISGIKIGGDDSDLTLGSPVSSGTQVIFSCASGTAFNRYRVEVGINTTLGEVLQGDGFLHVTTY